jgi:Zn-dependent protease with chaperone function
MARFFGLGRVLYLSLPLCRMLRPAELAAVIGHVFGHFRGRDLWFGRCFYPILRGTAESLAALSGAADSLFHAIPLMPAHSILAYVYDAFAAAEAKSAIGHRPDLRPRGA